MFKKVILQISIIFSLLALNPLFAQEFSEKQLREWSKNPVWIEMMDNPNANYFETVAAFEAFWKNRELPEEENKILGASREDREHVETPAEHRKRKRAEKKMDKEEKEAAVLRHKYAFAVKKYHHWKLVVDPYIQPDGRILTKEEQLKLHDQQR